MSIKFKELCKESQLVVKVCLKSIADASCLFKLQV